MSLQGYYDDFRQGHWADPEPENCLCRGHGWALSDVDTWHQCPIHYNGQQHPEDYEEVAGPVAPPLPSVVQPPDDGDIPF